MFLSRGDRDLGVAFQTHPGRQAFISSGSKEARSALESRRISHGAHWVDSRESSLLRRLEEVARLVARPCRRRRPSSLDDGGISGLFSSGGPSVRFLTRCGGPSVRFLTRYDGEVSEPLVGRQGSRVSMRVARGSASLLPSHGRGLWPRDVLKKVSRGLSRVEAGNPGFPRLVQVTSGGFSWWL